MKKLRTNLRRLFIIAILLLPQPTVISLAIGAGLVVIGQIIHFIAAGYLVKKEEMVTAGPYRFTRNPFYVANLLYDIGICVMANNPYIALIYLPLFYLVVIPRRIRKEQAFLGDKFGADYKDYCRKVPVFFPRLLPAKLDKVNGRFAWSQIIEYRELWRVMRGFGLILVLYLQFNIQFNILKHTTQWNSIFSTPYNIIALSLLGLIIIIPPIIEFGIIQRKISK